MHRCKRAVPQYIQILSSYYGLVYTLRSFQNRALRRIFAPKRAEVIGGWRKLHNEQLHSLYSSPSRIRSIKSRTMRWAGHVARRMVNSNTYRVFMGEPEGKRQLRRHKRKREDNIKMDIR
jgi:hypothetical protein